MTVRDEIKWLQAHRNSTEIAPHLRRCDSANTLLIALKTKIPLVCDNNNTACSFQERILAVNDKIKMTSNPSK